jgi:RimJ/RimL family protein N-acetyltransferase
MNSTEMTKRPVPDLVGERVSLRRARPEDIAARRKLGNDPDIVRMYGDDSRSARPMTEEEAERWVRRLLDHDHAWIIEAGALIREIRLDRVDVWDRRAVLAVGIADKTRLGQGLGTEAIRRVLRYAFDVLGLHRVSARVLDYNTRAIRACEKCGFVVEGREWESANVDGKWHDDVMMGVLDNEFESAVQRSQRDHGLA